MKRGRESRAKSPGEELGAIEFAAALNGDDPHRMLDCLKRFVKIVRYERRLALALDDEDGSISSSSGEESEEEDIEEKQTKKFKASESWKEDTRSYDVPFVGTSVAKGGRDRGTAIVGQWPTGLLQAYLERSSSAAELTGDSLLPPNGYIHKSLLRNKQGKLSQAIYKAYLKALAELVTAAIPKDILQKEIYPQRSFPTATEKAEEDTHNDNSPRFLGGIIKERVPELLGLLQSDTKRGKGTCGPMVPLALQVLARVAGTSIQNARNLVRSMEQSVPEAVWRATIRLPPLHKQHSEGQEDKPKLPRKHNRREEGRTAFLRLVGSLINTKDATVLYYCSSAGSKERKISSGLLVLALREAFKDSFEADDNHSSTRETYYLEQAHFLTSLRDLIWNAPNVLSLRRWNDLLSSDVLQHLSDISLCAPPLVQVDQVRMVLDGADPSAGDNDSSLSFLGIEARHLLWPLLANPTHSPLLQGLQQTASHEGHGKSSSTEQAVVRTMCRLLDTHTSTGKLALHNCLLQGIQKTPMLLPSLFQKLSVPDCTKLPLAFLARMRLILQLIQNGPSPSECLPKIVAAGAEVNAGAIIPLVVPVNLKKNLFGKAIQSKNAIIVSETLKVLHCVLLRVGSLREQHSLPKSEGGSNFWPLLSAKMATILPDIQVLLSTLSRYDLEGEGRAAPIVCGHLAQLLQTCASILPEVLQAVKFDWIKLLPSQAELFLGLPVMLQLRLLRTLETLMELPNVASTSSASCRILLRIMTSCRTHTVHKIARRLCCLVIRQVAVTESVDREVRQCLDYEISCWVDCMVPESIEQFCAKMEESSQLSFQSEIWLLQAWNEAGLPKPVPTLTASAILVVTISTLCKESSPQMVSLVGQVLTKCLLFHHNPLPLAVMIQFFFNLQMNEAGVEGADNQKVVLQYADSLVSFEKSSNSKRAKLLLDLLKLHFSKKSFHRKLHEYIFDDSQHKTASDALSPFSEDNAVAAVRQMSHMLACASNDLLNQKCLPLLRRLLPSALQASIDPGILLGNILGRMESCTAIDQKYIEVCALSHSKEQSSALVLDRILSRLNNAETDIYSSRTGREDLLTLFLTRPLLPQQGLAQTLHTLLGQCSSKEDSEILFPCLAKITTGYVAEMLSRNGSDSCWSPAQCSDAFKAWLSISHVCRQRDADVAVIGLCLRLEKLLCNLLAGSSAASSFLYLATLGHNTGGLIESMARTRLQTGATSFGDCLLAKLLDCDPHRFAPQLVRQLFEHENFNSYVESWNAGAFDEAILCIVKGMRRQRILKSESRQLVAALLHRSISVRNNAGANNKISTHAKVFSLLRWVDSKHLVDHEAKAVLLAKNVSMSLKSSSFQQYLFGDMDLSTRLAFLHTAVTLVEALAGSGGEEGAMLRQELVVALLVSLCEELPGSLRRERKAVQGKKATEEAVDPSLLMSWMLPMLEELPVLDIGAIGSMDPVCVSTALRGCLKYGMADTDYPVFLATSTKCLELARKLVAVFFASSTNLPADKLPSPSEVHDMIVSHSKFKKCLSGVSDDRARAARKLELVRLLLACLSRSEAPVEFSKDVWDVLFSAYNAGMGTIDMSLRRLLFVAVEQQAKSPTLPFLDQFRWQGIQEESNAKGQPIWDWLANGLSIGRVRQTLQRFPLDDSLEPAPLTDIEQWVPTHQSAEDKMEVDSESSSSSSDDSGSSSANDSSESSSDDTSSNSSRDGPAVTPTREEAVEDPLEDPLDGDLSYSPAYVLPLILAALENCWEDARGASEQVKQVENRVAALDDNKHEQFAKTAQRLCERGALSLAMASLCSRCARIRKVAVGVLGFIAMAAESGEARGIASWRERPQLAMLLRSLHRALAARRATLLANDKEKEKKATTDAWMVPMLPGFSALFLARTALALSRPGDSMFAPLSRFFLSIEHDHGAFRDLNRLPAFITFLCSAFDEPPGQSRHERLWALRLFRDGFLNDYCFKMASNCHAPELLLTTFFNYRMRTVSGNVKLQEEECILLLEAIEIMVRIGGRHAAYHIFTRMGMLSWLRSVLVSGALNQILPTTACRIAFLKLLSASIRHATIHERQDKETSDDMLFEKEIEFLLQPALSLCVAALNENSEDAGSDIASSAFTASIEALKSLKSTHQLTRAARGVSANGIPLASSLHYISKASAAPFGQEKEVWTTLVGLPLQLGADVETAVMFSGQAFEFLAEDKASTLSEGEVLGVMKRVVLVLEDILCGGDAGFARTELLPKLLVCRNMCFQHKESRDLWFVCLGHLLETSYPENNPERNDEEALWRDQSDTIRRLIEQKGGAP